MRGILLRRIRKEHHAPKQPMERHGAELLSPLLGKVLTTGNKEQEPGPTPPAMCTKALQQKAPQPYLIYFPGHHGEISLW